MKWIPWHVNDDGTVREGRWVDDDGSAGTDGRFSVPPKFMAELFKVGPLKRMSDELLRDGDRATEGRWTQ